MMQLFLNEQVGPAKPTILSCLLGRYLRSGYYLLSAEWYIHIIL